MKAKVIAGGFVVLAGLYLVLGLGEKPNKPPTSVVAVKTTIWPTKTPTPTRVPGPTPEIVTVQKDFLFTKVDNGYHVLIPSGSKYQVVDYDSVYIYLKNGLSMVTCTSCQPIINGCFAQIEGYKQEDPCDGFEENIGEGISLDGSYLESNVKKILGYRNLQDFKEKTGKGEFDIFVIVLTSDYRRLTAEDKALLLPILQSLK